jgi:hypothetical protein
MKGHAFIKWKALFITQIVWVLCKSQFVEVPASNPVSYPITIGGFED